MKSNIDVLGAGMMNLISSEKLSCWRPRRLMVEQFMPRHASSLFHHVPPQPPLKV
jgi:hypothetical protein